MSRRSLGALTFFVMLSGCMSDLGEQVSRFRGSESVAPMRGGAQKAVVKPSDASKIINALQLRPSVVITGTPYAQVSDAVIASDARVAEAELRVAELRAQAAAKNWLPRIGPRISLNSLGDFVAELVVNQVLFDNGRRQAERDLAKADVERAAVQLVEDGNRRVHDALSLYITAEENRDLANHLGRAYEDMARFEWVMQQRVNGGVSDMSDLNILQQKLATIRARAGEAQEATASAMAELNAMAVRPLTELRGIGALRDTSAGEPLGVLRARAEREQALAEARIARASNLPGLGANASVDRTGTVGGALEVTTDNLFGLGTLAEFKAIEATKETADRKVIEARENAGRQVASQQSRLAAYTRQAQEARGLTTAARDNWTLFQRQFEGGQRQVMDVVGTYETYARALETEIALKYKAARAELELARLRGGLAEGGAL
ncbi:TolC family protein [Sagittula salina]|uniref:TolC family protein n=1 Tax=Sagittula salina TaxID=2820268 RepID=A0A940MIB8_9RHOB|nr:TolC family protein [Sagittula salina]MBP0482290.1 TolC family protein [Sagittula salina]